MDKIKKRYKNRYFFDKCIINDYNCSVIFIMLDSSDVCWDNG